MHNKDKYPEIWAAKVKAEAELALLMTARKAHTDAIDVIQRKIDALAVEKDAENKLAMKDAARIGELRADIARFAKAMGAGSASGA